MTALFIEMTMLNVSHCHDHRVATVYTEDNRHNKLLDTTDSVSESCE